MKKQKSKVNEIPSYNYSHMRAGASDFKSIPSKKTDLSPAKRSESLQYTGTELIGIATMHKSNAVPVTKNSEMAKEIAKMRRS